MAGGKQEEILHAWNDNAKSNKNWRERERDKEVHDECMSHAIPPMQITPSL